MYTLYDRIFGDFPAKNTVYTPYIYGSGQPYTQNLGCVEVLNEAAKCRIAVHGTSGTYI
jgi:hypothetical protein